MKVLISADMEGATGVTWPADCQPGTEQWQRCRRMFTGDVNAAIAGLYDGGATSVVVNEAHATMRNLLLEELDERATMLTGRHKELSMVEGIDDPDVAGIAFIGYHAGAGTDGVLAHTYLANSITGVWANGKPASEGRLNALLAAELGVPVVLVTGDDRTCADAQGYAPAAHAVPVKQCVTRYSAVCNPPAVTGAAIRQAARRAVSLAGRQQPAREPEYRIDVEVDAAQLAQAASLVPGVQRTGDRTVAFITPTARDMLRCFKVVCTMISAAIEESYG
jgi:D-amino peptidase